MKKASSAALLKHWWQATSGTRHPAIKGAVPWVACLLRRGAGLPEFPSILINKLPAALVDQSYAASVAFSRSQRLIKVSVETPCRRA